MMRWKYGIEGFSLVLSALLMLPACAGQSSSDANHSNTAAAAKQERTLVWSDEFNGPDGSAPDAHKWTIVNDGSGFGNHELEYYRDSPANVHIEKGMLVITARKQAYKGHAYTSARLESSGHFEVKYGRIEARIKVPRGQGIWPAFWMLGANYKSVGWPRCGEIDIMENVGFEPSKVHGSLHGPGYSGNGSLTGVYTLPGKERFSDGFHDFAVEWEPGTIRFYVDNVLYETQSAAHLPAGGQWAFDHPFFVLLNVAVGGDWPGAPDGTSTFPASMLVDYVRVYSLKGPPA